MTDVTDSGDRSATRNECLSEIEGCLSEYSSPWRTTGCMRDFAEEVLAISEKFLYAEFAKKYCKTLD